MRQKFVQARHAYSPRDWQMKLDDVDVSGRYLLVEAMNIRAVGPVLTLAPSAETNDGALNFVAVRDSQRSVLADYLNARLESETVEFPFPAQEFCRLEIFWQGAPLHLDDKTWPPEEDAPARASAIEITIEPGALEIWSLS